MMFPYGNIVGEYEIYIPGNRQDRQRNPENSGCHAEGFGAHLWDRLTVCYRPRRGQRNLPAWKSADGIAHPRNKVGADTPLDPSERRLTMARTLDVYLHNQLVGHLTQDDGGQMLFDYIESWLQKPGAMPLSHSLPLRKERFKRNECQGFFGGLLPEQSKREIIARNLGISAHNDYAMLEQIGGECAGAVTFIPAGGPLPEGNYRYRVLSSKELAAVLRDLPRRPLLAGEDGIRLSLAGAPDT